MNQDRLLAVIQRIETDLIRLAEVVESVQHTLKRLSNEIKQSGQRVETLQAGQRFLAGQFKQRDGTLYGPRMPRENDESD